MIFVFGSNLSGIHGAGAAKIAYYQHQAIWGQGYGRQGNSFAIPTKDVDVKTSLALKQIKHVVNTFLEYAENHPGDKFKVTRIGCGLAGFQDDEIAPLFVEHPDNCFFDIKWRKYLPEGTQYWGTY